MDAVQSALGVMFLLLGSLHFALRDREPQNRSVYIGAVRFGRAARLTFAAGELLLGAALLLTVS